MLNDTLNLNELELVAGGVTPAGWNVATGRITAVYSQGDTSRRVPPYSG